VLALFATTAVASTVLTVQPLTWAGRYAVGYIPRKPVLYAEDLHHGLVVKFENCISKFNQVRNSSRSTFSPNCYRQTTSTLFSIIKKEIREKPIYSCIHSVIYFIGLYELYFIQNKLHKLQCERHNYALHNRTVSKTLDKSHILFPIIKITKQCMRDTDK